jgi:pyruvate/2-oxoglutarate/acetoin dehydrogenase E1 component
MTTDAELRRAKDHLKGSLMLSLENTASRMSHLARQEIYFDRHFGLDETLSGVERVTNVDVPLPYAANLEKMALITADQVIAAAKKVCYR